MAVFRQREWLADETAARITGKPLALARALQKAANFDVALQHGANTARALCIFGYTANNWWDNLFDTHPSIEERIERLRMYSNL
jgi:heat shock protein HtpX